MKQQTYLIFNGFFLLVVMSLFSNGFLTRAAWAAPGNAGKGSESQQPGANKDRPGFASIIGPSKKGEDVPLFIKSKSVTVDNKKRSFSYRGEVEATQGDLTVRADLMNGEYDASNQIQTITCVGSVVITRGEGLKATSQRAVYRVPKAVIELTENPELTQNGNTLAADRVIVYVNDDRAEAEGNVRAKVLKASQPGISAPKETR